MNLANRRRMHDLMTLLLEHEPQINYPLHDIRGSLDAATYRLSEAAMRRRLQTGGHLMFDCSQAATQIFKWADLEDPNKAGYATWPSGVPKCYTGSLLAALPHYSAAKGAGVGAIVIYGPSTGDHASLVYESGADPLLWSHGFDGGPVLIRLSQQRQFHRSPVTLLNVSRLGPV